MKKKPIIQNFIYLSIFTAILTIILKSLTYYFTGSIGLLSDALESGVNLVAAVVALIMYKIARKPADEKHNFGHEKAEYFSSVIEGTLILFAAISILFLAIPKLFRSQPLENIDIGFIVSIIASLLNLVTARILIKQGKRYKSIILEADGKHLMTDVWTTFGVLAGITFAKLTGYYIIDPILAILVAIHIIYEGVEIISKSVNGLLDSALPSNDLKQLENILKEEIIDKNLEYHMLKTRQSSHKAYILFHLLVPKNWTIKQAHDKADKIEQKINKSLTQEVLTTIHIEPKGLKESYSHKKQ